MTVESDGRQQSSEMPKSGQKKKKQHYSAKAALSIAASGSKGVVGGALIADIIEKQRAEWADLSHLPAKRTRKLAATVQKKKKKEKKTDVAATEERTFKTPTWPAEEFFHEASKLSYVDHNHD